MPRATATIVSISLATAVSTGPALTHIATTTTSTTIGHWATTITMSTTAVAAYSAADLPKGQSNSYVSLACWAGPANQSYFLD